MGFPAAELPAGPFVPARHVDALNGVPEWNDINPRVGAAIDVFGNGRTAREGVDRPLQPAEPQRPDAPVPPVQLVGQRRRPATGPTRTGNYIPDCDLQNFTAQDLSAAAATSARSNVNFGKFNPARDACSTTRCSTTTATSCGTSTSTCSTRSSRGLSVERRLQPQLGRQLHGHREHAARPERLRRVLHHRARTIRGCRTAAASSSAATTTSSRRSSAGARCASPTARRVRQAASATGTASRSAPTAGCRKGITHRRRPRHRPAGRRPLLHRGHPQPAARHHGLPAARRRPGPGGRGLQPVLPGRDRLGGPGRLPAARLGAAAVELQRQLHLPRYARRADRRHAGGDLGAVPGSSNSEPHRV